jgi:hypothetical protein
MDKWSGRDKAKRAAIVLIAILVFARICTCPSLRFLLPVFLTYITKLGYRCEDLKLRTREFLNGVTISHRPQKERSRPF